MKTKKTLSILLAIVMIATTIPFLTVQSFAKMKYSMFSLYGYIGGEDVGSTANDWDKPTAYVFSDDGTLTVKLPDNPRDNEENCVAVKTNDGQIFYMLTEFIESGDTASGQLYNCDVAPYPSQKMAVPRGKEVKFTIVSNGDGLTLSYEVVKETDITKIETTSTPIYTPADYDVYVTGRALKFQFVDAKGNTWTYDRNKAEIKSYDKDGKECDSDARNLAYEVWSVNAVLPAGDYTAKVKYSNKGWQTDDEKNFNFTVENQKLTNVDLVSAELNATEGRKVPVTATVTVGSDVQKVQLERAGQTITLANGIDNGDGTKTYTGTISTAIGENTINVNIKANNVWNYAVTTLTYIAK